MKIKEEHLKKITEIVSKAQDSKSKLGDIVVRERELSKHKETLFAEIEVAEKELREYQNLIREVYGDISIDLSDGSYKMMSDTSNVPTEDVTVEEMPQISE